MSDENLMSLFPQKRIKPYDGMPITAEVWDIAHSYHRETQQSHNLFFHGMGILTGMEVVASDPADNIIYILPGIAVDETGQVIVLPEPVAYDLGNEVDGQLILLISHRESSTGTRKTQKESGIQYIKDEFLLIARADIPDGQWIELARFQREDRITAISDAVTPLHPGQNEIDLRYRPTICFERERLLTSAVAYLGKGSEESHGRGLTQLAQEVRCTQKINLVVDDKMKVSPELLSYDMIYLVGQGKFTLNKTQVQGLQGYIERSGILLMEACDEEAADSFQKIIDVIGLELQAAARGNDILENPYLFAAPPAGFLEEGEVKIGKGIIFSTFNYGQLWNGEGKDRIPSRAEIRAAVEWGTNVLFHIIAQKG